MEEADWLLPLCDLCARLWLHVCYVNGIIYTGFTLDVFVSCKLPWKSNLLPFCKAHGQNTPCLGFVGITPALDRADISGWVKVDGVSGKH